ncbi:hypothetical protein J3E05_001622 [Methanococcus voltae]|nr:hypothetical protein [Methanococcus voltae]
MADKVIELIKTILVTLIGIYVIWHVYITLF